MQENQDEAAPLAPVEPSQAAAPPPVSRWARLTQLKAWYLSHKKLSIPLSIGLLVIVLAAVPFSRYALAGTVRQTDLQIKVVDATANTPVSGAVVSLGQVSAQTNSEGIANLGRVKVGHRSLTISKKYYLSRSLSLLVPILKQKTVPAIQLTATGRQVQIDVSDLIDKSPLANTNISVAGITAKTDKSGSAVVVLPVGKTEQSASLSLPGYNNAQVTVKVSNDKVQDNKFSLTPAGKVYFLSNLSGKLDVVKTNLDGSDRQTVLAGTGNEDDNNTVLLASRNWKYLALLSRRAGNSPTLYLISTADDSVTTIDSGSYSYSLAGWINGDFVYTLSMTPNQPWQAGQQVIKSYDPVAKKLTVLDQTTASGTSTYDYVGQQIGNVFSYNSKVYYTKGWNASSAASLADKQATFNSVNTDGSAKSAVKSFSLQPNSTNLSVNLSAQLDNPSKIELYFYDGVSDNYFSYANGQVTPDKTATSDSFYANYSTYLLSPSGNQTFWSEPRDGKNSLFIGDQNGQNGKQIASLSDYSPYGWYSDNYLLVSQNGSQLYIMAKDGTKDPIKISDYHKPAVSLNGYGGGYGGL